MRKLWMAMGVVMVVASMGCRHRRVAVASTPEGNACRRECMKLFNDCQDGKRRNRKMCAARENECLTTCPSAVSNEVYPAEIEPPPPPPPPPPQAVP